MNLVNAPNIIYASNNNVCGPGNNVACNAGNDPYDNSNESTMLNQVPADLRDKVGSANYDVGHVIGTGGAGIAGLGVVCDNTGTLRERCWRIAHLWSSRQLFGQRPLGARTWAPTRR